MFKVQAHQTKTLSWWNKQRDQIDLEPSYQRKGNLWGDRDKAFLIDSVINGFDIPKIYLSDFTIVNSPLNEKNLPYAVIDGRQRLESIFGFFSNKIPLNKDFIYYANPSIKVAGKYYSELKNEYPKLLESLEEFNLDVMSVIADDIEKIRDLFVRLNKSKALTGAELRNAMEGIVPDLIRGLVDRPFFKENIKFNVQRGQDSNAAAKILLIEYRGRFVDSKKTHLDKFVQEGIKTENVDSFIEAAFRAQKIIDQMGELFARPDEVLSAQGLLTIFYVFFRDNNPKEMIRPFIAYFLKQKNKNVMLSKSNPTAANQKYLTFDSLSKNANDIGGLQGSYNLLVEFFVEYKAFQKNT
jgi:uncharacterized protein with ParB-like and HNH nuclease domain